MRPLMHPQLVNGRTGDPAVYVETLFEGRTLLLDLGDLSALPARKVLRLEQAFVSHTHIDHFVGFDRMLRLLVGREKTVRLYGPRGFVDRVQHKLSAYEWNLVAGYENELTFEVVEVISPELARTARFRLRSAFAREDLGTTRLADGIVHQEAAFSVATAILAHRDTASLGFAISEAVHVNVWKNRLAELDLPVGPWLRDLKRAVLDEQPHDTLIAVGAGEQRLPLATLRDAVTVTPGQKLAYVTDVADTPANREAIVRLVRGADVLFIEAVFAHKDAALARERAHLTTTAAGEIARAAGARRVEPFHFSPRYSGEDERMLNEVMTAFGGAAAVAA